VNSILSPSIIKCSTKLSDQNVPAISSSQKPTPTTTTTTTGFSLFNLIKKKKDKSPTPLSSTSLNNSTSSISNQQQILAEQQQLQQQKLKQQKNDLKTISQYIKSFESIVIKSLRQYTLTTSVNLQSRILELLVQLIFLKVDYCVLDSDRIFIDYVLRQFEHLEQSQNGVKLSSNGHENGAFLLSKSYLYDLYENFDSETTHLDALNPFDLNTMLNKLCFTLNTSFSSVFQTNQQNYSQIFSNVSLRQQEHQQSHVIIPKLFDFLLVLSHEKKVPIPSSIQSGHQKTATKNGILSVPEVMQLCDNLIASENSPHTHAIPALRPIVIDLFLNRSSNESADSKDLEAQQDVIMMTMLRLVQYPSVWPLFTLVALKYRSSNQDKWKKCSRQICDALFDSMRSSTTKLKFSECNGHELRSIRRYSQSYIPYINSLKQLIYLMNCLAPQVFRPVDFILLSLFETSKVFFFKSMQKDLSSTEINNSICVLLFHLYILLNNSTEDQLLIRLFNLIPQIISSYSTEGHLYSANQQPFFTPLPQFPKKTNHFSSSSSPKSNSDHNTTTTDENESSHSSTTGGDDAFDSGNNVFDTDDENEFNLNESALFLSQFLLRIYEILFEHVDSMTKFNMNNYVLGSNLTSSCPNAFLNDFQLNRARDLNYEQQLLFNKLMFLLYLVNSGNFSKISNAISLLINDKHKNKKFPRGKLSFFNIFSQRTTFFSININLLFF
jgi:hypothetical protein